jgi:hypothetical protein
MTGRGTDSIIVLSLSQQRIQAGSNGGKLTSYGVGLLLKEVDRRLRLIDQINECISDPPNSIPS